LGESSNTLDWVELEFKQSVWLKNEFVMLSASSEVSQLIRSEQSSLEHMSSKISVVVSTIIEANVDNNSMSRIVIIII
jgi:hypothetical protein